AYWSLVVVLAATLVVGAFVHVSRSVTGRAEAGENPDTVVVWVPVAGASDVSVGQRVSVPTSGGEVDGHVVGDAQVGSAVSPAPDRAAVAVALDRALPQGTTINGRAVVHLSARRLLVLVIPELQGILGN